MKSYNRFQIKATKTITFCGNGAAYISLICYLSIKSFYNFFLSVKAIKINKNFVSINYLVYHFVGFSQTCVSHVAEYGDG